MLIVAQVALLAAIWSRVFCGQVASSLPPGEYGVDFAYDPCTVDCFNCLLSKNYAYFISGIYHPEQPYIPTKNASTVNDIGFTNIRNAYIAGFKEVHAYYFPCTDYAKYRCPNVTEQVNMIVDYMEGLFTPFYNPSFWWIDVEAPEHWSTNTGRNVATFTQIINAFMNRGIYATSIGIYTHAYPWNTIMGGIKVPWYPLWWANPDGRPDAHFSPFAGWQQPAMHQYKWGSVTDSLYHECRIKADRNWRRKLPECKKNSAATVRCMCGDNDNICSVGQYCDGYGCYDACPISDTTWVTDVCWCGNGICGDYNHYDWFCRTGNRCQPISECGVTGVVADDCTCGSAVCIRDEYCGSSPWNWTTPCSAVPSCPVSDTSTLTAVCMCADIICLDGMFCRTDKTCVESHEYDS